MKPRVRIAAVRTLDGGEMVVLDHGDLADALLASMAVPGAFVPVVLEGRTLVDGGYALDSVTAVDQFLFTHHLEAVAVLTRS